MIYLPEQAAESALSAWAGRPDGLVIDPIGVEAVPLAPGAGPRPYLHVLCHRELPAAHIRSWMRRQVAQHLVRLDDPDAAGDTLNRLTDDRLAALADRDETPTVISVDGAPVTVAAWEITPMLWAAYTELGDDLVAIIGSDLPLSSVRLRTATSDEARELRTQALRV